MAIIEASRQEASLRDALRYEDAIDKAWEMARRPKGPADLKTYHEAVIALRMHFKIGTGEVVGVHESDDGEALSGSVQQAIMGPRSGATEKIDPFFLPPITRYSAVGDVFKYYRKPHLIKSKTELTQDEYAANGYRVKFIVVEYEDEREIGNTFEIFR